MAVPKKPNFPSKTCPKCHNIIPARSKSHEECGWKEMSSDASGARPAKTHAGNGKPMSKMEGVRQALSKLGSDAKPLAIKDFLKKQFGIRMDPTVISSYKTTIGAKRHKRGRKPGRPAGAHSAAKSNHSAHISIEDIRAVKLLADRIGADKLRQLTDVLAK